MTPLDDRNFHDLNIHLTTWLNNCSIEPAAAYKIGQLSSDLRHALEAAVLDAAFRVAISCLKRHLAKARAPGDVLDICQEIATTPRDDAHAAA